MEKIIFVIHQYTSKKGWQIAWDLGKTFFPHKYQAENYIKEYNLKDTCVTRYVKE